MTNITQSPNINHLWAQLIVEELVRNGVEYFCISPGSRSSPLTTAAAINKKARCFVHFDERGAAFHALGYSAATKKPCTLICTSGTAAANFLPAVIEASKKKLPLIILTADRPPELRQTGADQTMDQVKLYGAYVRWDFDLPCPTMDIEPAFVLTTIDQAIYRAKGNPPGPVHLNCMYREPLAPQRTQKDFREYCSHLNEWSNKQVPFTQYVPSEKSLAASELKDLQEIIADIRSGVIVVGKLSSIEEQNSIIRLSEKLKWPIFPDITSGLRLGRVNPNIISYYDQILLSAKAERSFTFDGVLHFGGRITSKRWYDIVDRKKIKNYIMVLNHPLRNDPGHCVAHRVECTADRFCDSLIKKIPSRSSIASLARWQQASQKVHAFLSKKLDRTVKLSEPGVARAVSANIHPRSCLFLSNSMPIRDVDMYGDPAKHPVTISANRGVSGIDGNLATATGFLTGSEQPLTLMIGDLALLHDLNSLSMLSRLSRPIIIIVINNNGGGIFSFLPISDIGEIFEQYFGTPHNLTFQGACAMFGIDHYSPSDRNEFVSIYQQLQNNKRSGLIEIRTNRKENLDLHRSLQKDIQALLSR